MIKVGINGFGRIGRVVFRVLMQRQEQFELCGINLRNAELDYMAYQLRYDSIFGRFEGDIEIGENCLIVNGKKIHVFSESDASQIKWSECGAEYIIESTGAFNTMEKAALHKIGGAKKVILTAPSKDDIMPTFVMGVNHLTYQPEYDIVSNASCTTNCLAQCAPGVVAPSGPGGTVGHASPDEAERTGSAAMSATHPTRLETRTKESNACASQGLVRKPPWRNEGEGPRPGARGGIPRPLQSAEGAPPARLARRAGEVEHERTR